MCSAFNRTSLLGSPPVCENKLIMVQASFFHLQYYLTVGLSLG